MRRRHVLSFVALFASSIVAACTNQNSTIFITQFNSRTFTNGSCVSSNTPLADPRWYPAIGQPYIGFFKVTNLIRRNPRDIANDPSFVHLTEIEVELTDADGNTIDVGAVNPYTIPVSGPLIPSASSATSAGTADVFATIIPSSYGPALSAFNGGYVVAHIRAFGRTLGGIDVDSSSFLWPILIGDSPGPVCEGDATAVDSCFPGQDGASPIISDDDPFCQSD
jgi:hypothetical protein